MVLKRVLVNSGVAATLLLVNFCCCSVLVGADDGCGDGAQFVDGPGPETAAAERE